MLKIHFRNKDTFFIFNCQTFRITPVVSSSRRHGQTCNTHTNKRSQPPKAVYKISGLFAHTEPAVVRGGHGGGALEPRHAVMRRGSVVSGGERRPKTKNESEARARQRVAWCIENKKISKPS